MDAFFLMTGVVLLILLDACVVTAPLMRCMLGIYLLMIMIIEIARRSLEEIPREQNAPELFEVFHSLWIFESTTQEFILGIDYTVLLLTLSGILSTLRRPHHLAFLKLPCDLAEFLYHREQLRRNAAHIARIRVQRLRFLDRRLRFSSHKH